MKRADLHLEKPKLQGYSFEKVTYSPQGINVLDATASNTYGCVSRDSCGSSTQWKWPNWNKDCPTPP
jgi:hypothetical protein